MTTKTWPFANIPTHLTEESHRGPGSLPIIVEAPAKYLPDEGVMWHAKFAEDGSREKAAATRLLMCYQAKQAANRLLNSRQ